MNDHRVMALALRLSPLARKVVNHMLQSGSISAREAYLDLNEVTSGSLTRRITEIESVGIPIKRDTKRNPNTGRSYTRYSIKQD